MTAAGVTHDLAALSAAEREALEALAGSTSGPARPVQRAQALVALSDGVAVDEVAARLGRTRRTILRWRSRFTSEGVTAVLDAPRSGRPPRLSIPDVMLVCETAVARPSDVGVPITCWSLRHLARHLTERGVRIGHERLRQILHAHRVQKKAEVSKQRSTDPAFAEKRDAVIQLYRTPPADSAVVCLDQLGPVSLHATPGHQYAGPGREPHHDAEYKRHGTIYTLGALLPHLGTVFARSFMHYNALVLILFLGSFLRLLPDNVRTVYIILDNASSHTAKRVSNWLKAHWSDTTADPATGQRGKVVHLVFLPSKAAWLNLIEPFWRIMREEMINGSDFKDRAEFRAALRDYIAYHNRVARPFIWGRQRKARVFLLRHMRQKLHGRAGARTMPPRLLRLIARAAA